MFTALGCRPALAYAPRPSLQAVHDRMRQTYGESMRGDPQGWASITLASEQGRGLGWSFARTAGIILLANAPTPGCPATRQGTAASAARPAAGLFLCPAT